MRKTWWTIPALFIFAAIGAPNAIADSVVFPKITTTPGGPLTLGSGVGLSDKVNLTGGDGFWPGKLTVGLTGPPGATGVGFGPSVDTIQIAMPATAPPTQTIDLSGPTPPVPGTYTWVVILTAVDGTTMSGPTETQVVSSTPEPGTGALMLAGIGFLLVVTLKRCTSGLTPTS